MSRAGQRCGDMSKGARPRNVAVTPQMELPFCPSNAFPASVMGFARWNTTGVRCRQAPPPSDYLWIKGIKPSRVAPSPLAHKCREITVSEKRRPRGAGRRLGRRTSLAAPSPQTAPLDFGAIPTDEVNFDPNAHPSAGHDGGRGAAGGGGAGRGAAREPREPRSGARRAGRTAEGAATPCAPSPFRPACNRDGWRGGRGPRRRVGLLRSVSPRGRAEQLQSAGSGRWGGRCAGSGRCAEPPLESAERGCRGAGGEERTPRRRGTARRGRSRARHRDLLLACRRALSSRLIYFFPTYTLIRWDFFFPSLSCRASPRPVPSLSSQFGFFFFFPVTIPIFKAVDAEREAERAGGRRSARPLRHRHPDVRSGLGLSPFLPPGEATPARREEGAQRKRCIETFRANFVASARSRERARRGCLPAPAPGERPRTGAAVELGLPGGGGRAAAGRPRSLRSALRSAHRERQRGPAESRPYGGVKAETPKRRPPSPGAPRSAREAAGAEEARARARQRGGSGGAAARRSAAGPAPRRAPATMNFLLTWIHWGLAALLYLQSAEVSGGAGGGTGLCAGGTFPLRPFSLSPRLPFASHLPTALAAGPGGRRRRAHTCAGACAGLRRGASGREPRAECPRTCARNARPRRGAPRGVAVGPRGRARGREAARCLLASASPPVPRSPDIAKGCSAVFALGPGSGSCRRAEFKIPRWKNK